MTDAEKLEELLKPVKDSFIRILAKDLPTFVKFKQARSEGATISDDFYDAMKAKCHKIKGSSKTLGFGELGEAAAKVESCIEAILSAENENIASNELNSIFDEFLSSVRVVI